MLHIVGQIVTIDLACCQIEIAQKISSKGADYVLALKGNQGSLHQAVIDYFQEPGKLHGCSFYEKHNKGHGRTEHRQCYAAQPKVPDAFNKWQDLKTIIMLKSSRIIKGVEQQETRYFISSLQADAQRLLSVIRLHWNIENNSHWVLDVIFKEEDRTIWNRNIAYNESIIRRVGLNLLKAYQKVAQPLVRSDKTSLKAIRKLIIADDIRMGKLLRCF
jgi:predicted transposase YbfD/YdcC